MKVVILKFMEAFKLLIVLNTNCQLLEVGKNEDGHC